MLTSREKGEDLHNYGKRLAAAEAGKLLLLTYLIHNHGGMSAAKRLVGAGAVSVNGRVVQLVELDKIVLNFGDTVRIGKHWSALVTTLD